MVVVNQTIRSYADAAEFVRACETEFENRLDEIVHSIVYDCHPECITLSGPTCAGKTTTANKLTAEIAASGKKAVVLSIDDFFHERMEEKLVDGNVDFDSVAAIDLDMFAACVADIMEERPTVLPRFDFITGRRKTPVPYTHNADDIILFEGIQAVYPEVVSLLRPYPYKSIFISVCDDITVNGTFFSKHEVRLARRLVRDYRFRSASPEFTLDIWKNVRANEEANIFPYMNGCDFIVNSLLKFELFMLGQFAIPLLETVTADSAHYETAVNLKNKLLSLRGNDIDPRHLSEHSLYREFLG